MRAVRHTVNGIEVLEVPPPDGEGVRVKVAACGICGSDLHLMGFGPLPNTLGHEFAGWLDDGTPVAVQPQEPCGTCDQCTAGHGQRCRTGMARILGISKHGALADEVLVHPDNVFPLPESIEVRDAGIIEQLAVALHGVHRAGAVAGQRVLVIGGGMIGLATVAAARHVGCEVDLLARYPHQQAAGERLGARLETADEYDVVFEAAGSQSALDDAIRLAAPGATIGIPASYWEPVSFGLGACSKEVSFVPAMMFGHHAGRREFADSVDLLAADPGIGGAVITHRYSLDDASEAFRVAADRSAGAIKVVVEP